MKNLNKSIKEYKGKVCKGSWAFGNNCKTCEKCIDTKPGAKDKELEDKFLWLQVLHIVEDTLPTDNPATGQKTIQALYDKFEIKPKE